MDNIFLVFILCGKKEKEKFHRTGNEITFIWIPIIYRWKFSHENEIDFIWFKCRKGDEEGLKREQRQKILILTNISLTIKVTKVLHVRGVFADSIHH